ncbi:putative DnaJ-like protein subfamily B member 12 [Hypsibius exemplaris]|uniref:DnaJ-like protein subfamily B member 12 n=1 Tax=Hypsibius exemplaris TaxID=2072580 RepID=A0A1W0X1T9_HYPEX|nr:putative DnaJ-like protein subfamily B member 12 [Hypsibius exemplaris]
MTHPSRSRRPATGKGTKSSIIPLVVDHDLLPLPLQVVLRVKKCTTFYKVLFMEKDSFSEVILKKQYRKLASGEAFKIVGKAYAVLSNPQKKSDYDAGSENYETVQPNPHFARQQGRRRYYRSGNFMFFEDEASADDIFNMFFGQGFNRFAEHDENDGHRHGVHAHRGDPNAAFSHLSPTPNRSTTSSIPHQYLTRNLDVRFYLKDDIHTKLTNKEMLTIEISVEELYLNNLKESCVRERAYKENVMWRGRFYEDHKLVQKGRELETPSCDTLSRAYNKLASVFFC